MTRIAELSRLLDRHSATPGAGTHDCAVPRLALIRSEQPTDRMHTVYRPAVCITAQGAKRTIAGERVLRYGPGDYLTISVDLPVVGEVTAASAEEPYLCMKLEPDPAQLSDLLIGGAAAADDEPDLGLAVAKATDDILDAAIRLVGLLDRPEAIPALAPLYERELCYFLLQGPQGARLRQLALAEGRMAQIVRAIRFITERFREPISVEDAAAEAGMSASSFHQHFKAVTAQSPLQFQKLLRLQEARRVLVADGGDAASAAFAVGYSSPQQFSREYVRLFGLPPQRDAARLRAEAAATGGARVAASA
jgi:AraC-like DNA-binding protein